MGGPMVDGTSPASMRAWLAWNDPNGSYRAPLTDDDRARVVARIATLGRIGPVDVRDPGPDWYAIVGVRLTPHTDPWFWAGEIGDDDVHVFVDDVVTIGAARVARFGLMVNGADRPDDAEIVAIFDREMRDATDDCICGADHDCRSTGCDPECPACS